MSVPLIFPSMRDRRLAITPSISDLEPWISICTVPSGSFRTHPLTARPVAHSRAVARKPTFWTRPENV